MLCLDPGWIIMLNTQSKFHCKHLQLIFSPAPLFLPQMTDLHKADQIELFAVAKFCCHVVWKCCNIHVRANRCRFLCDSNQPSLELAL